MNNKEKILKQFNNDLYERYPHKIRLADFFKEVDEEKIKFDYFDDVAPIELEDYEWMDKMNSVINRVKTIISNPRLHIKTEREVKRAETASKVDHICLQNTFRDLKLWRKKIFAYEPERVYCNIFDDLIAIYENRFVTYLVDKMFEYISKQIAVLYAKINRLDKLVQTESINLGDTDAIGECTPFYRQIDAREYGAKVVMVDAKERAPLLTTINNPIVIVLEKLLRMKQKIIQIFETLFYKECKKAGTITEFYPTNMLLQHPDYSYCWFFYNDFMLKIPEEKTSYITKRYYENYVLLQIVSTLHKMGFEVKRKYESVERFNGRYLFDNVKMVKEPITININSIKNNYIEIDVELKYYLNKFLKDIDLNNRRKNRIILELYPNMKRKYPTNEEMNGYFKKIVANRLKEFDNVYVISTLRDISSPDVVMCSPEDVKLDSNLENMIKSFTILVEGSSFIYQRKCPVCGSTMVTYEDGNYTCDDCHSLYSILRSGKEIERNEMIWIKRMKKAID